MRLGGQLWGHEKTIFVKNFNLKSFLVPRKFFFHLLETSTSLSFLWFFAFLAVESIMKKSRWVKKESLSFKEHLLMTVIVVSNNVSCVCGSRRREINLNIFSCTRWCLKNFSTYSRFRTNVKNICKI